MNLGHVLRRWRLHSELTVQDVAQRFGIAPAALSRFERGAMVDVRTLAKILSWLMQEA